ncbi:MAG: hypothetical protein P1U74_11135 [Legionellaceae bacterium]|nr:hypothetical protein [Legionellaceae bacterium]
MYVQQERIDAFYAQLEVIVQRSQDGDTHLSTDFDRNFLNRRNKNLSIDFWIENISKRMADQYKYFSVLTSINYEYSISADRCWYELAFDISQIVYDPAKGQNVSWLNILFPKLQTLVDPISFKPLFDSSPSAVYILDSMPSFQDKKLFVRMGSDDNTSNSHKKTSENVVDETTLLFKKVKIELHEHRCNVCFLVKSSGDFYRISRNHKKELVHIPSDKKPGFVLGLIKLLGIRAYSTNSSSYVEGILPVEGTRMHSLVSSANLDKLIVQSGGYPRLDLGDYLLSRDHSKLYHISSFLPSYSIESHINRAFIDTQAKSDIRILAGEIFQDSAQPSYVPTREGDLPWYLYDQFGDVSPRPMFPIERAKFSSMVVKMQNNLLRSSGKFIRNPWTNVVTETETPLIKASEKYIASLFDTIQLYYKVKSNPKGLVEFKTALSKWSINVALSSVYKTINLFGIQLNKTISYERLDKAYKEDRVSEETFGDSNGISDLDILYSQRVTIISKKNTKIYGRVPLVQVFESILDEINQEVLDRYIYSICSWIKGNSPHLKGLSTLIYGNLANYKFKDGVNNNDYLIYSLKNLLGTCSEINKRSVKELMNYLSNEKIDKKYILSKLEKIYLQYDKEVANTVYDHTRYQSAMRSSWSTLAKAMAGAGFYDSYLELLCPSLMWHIDPVTETSISSFDLHRCVFSDSRNYLIILEHTQDLFDLTGEVYDCSGRKLRAMTSTEIARIEFADKRYRSFFNHLQSSGLTGVMLKASTWIGVYNLVNSTYYQATDKTRYILKVNDCEESQSFFSGKSLSQSAKGLYRFLSPTKVVEISIIKWGYSFYITVHNPKASEPIRRVKISQSETSYKYTNTLTQEQIDLIQDEIICVLRRKGYIDELYTPTISNIVRDNYSQFYSFIDNLEIEQRFCLLDTVVVLNGQLKYFSDIVSESKSSTRNSYKWILSLLIDKFPVVTFNEKLEKENAALIQQLRMRSSDSGLCDIQKEVEIIFISLMTYDFYNKDTRPCAKEFVFVECRNRIHRDVSSIYEFFRDNYFCVNKIDLADFYKRLLLDVIYPLYHKISDQQNERDFSERVCHWLYVITKGALFRILPIYEVDWMKKLCFQVINNSNLLNEYTLEKINILYDDLMGDILDEKTKRVKYNIKIIRFFKSLDEKEFLLFLRASGPNYQKEILQTFITTKESVNMLLDRLNLLSSCLETYEEGLRPNSPSEYKLHHGDNLKLEGVVRFDVDKLVGNLLKSEQSFPETINVEGRESPFAAFEF